MKKDRKEEKLFEEFSFVSVGGEVLVSVGRRDLVCVRFSVIEARGEGLSILIRGGRRDLICEPSFLFCSICSNWIEMLDIS